MRAGAQQDQALDLMLATEQIESWIDRWVETVHRYNAIMQMHNLINWTERNAGIDLQRKEKIIWKVNPG